LIQKYKSHQSYIKFFLFHFLLRNNAQLVPISVEKNTFRNQMTTLGLHKNQNKKNDSFFSHSQTTNDLSLSLSLSLNLADI